jgi:hypothetical protein
LDEKLKEIPAEEEVDDDDGKPRETTDWAPVLLRIKITSIRKARSKFRNKKEYNL